jgi:hypothetical protein
MQTIEIWDFSQTEAKAQVLKSWVIAKDIYYFGLQYIERYAAYLGCRSQTDLIKSSLILTVLMYDHYNSITDAQ